MAATATAATVIHTTPLPSVSETGHNLNTSATLKTPKRKMSLSNPTGPQTFPKPPLSPNSRSKESTTIFANWQNYNMNGNADANYVDEPSTPSPPSTMTTSSPRSSTTSSPAEPASHNQDHSPPSYFNGRKPRSASFAIPAPTSCCPNCGLRRPSSVSDHTIAPARTLSISSSTYHRPHLPLHLHCPDFCPDDHFPTQEGTSPTSPFAARRHHRRRSSLCYAESLVEDAKDIDGGNVPIDVRQTLERQAENIARKVVMRKAGLTDVRLVEEAIED